MENNYENIILNGNVPYKIFKFVSNDNQRIIPTHFHKEVELLCCIKGKLNIWIDGNLTTLNEGEIFFINSLTFHSTQALKKSEVIVLYQQDKIFNQENVNICINNVTNNQEYKKVFDLILKMEQLEQDTKKYNDYMVGSHIYLLNYLLLLYYSEIIDDKTERKTKQNSKFRETLNVLKSNLKEDLSLDEVGMLCGYSSAYLSRLFPKYTGQNFLDYKRSLGIEYVLILIDSTEKNLEEIAELAGFPSEKSMRNYFKKKIGITPIEYKMSKKRRK